MINNQPFHTMHLKLVKNEKKYCWHLVRREKNDFKADIVKSLKILKYRVKKDTLSSILLLPLFKNNYKDILNICSI